MDEQGTKLTAIDDIARGCSDCGNCLAACPVYESEPLETNSPRGKINIIKALQDGRLNPSPLSREIMYRCLLCGGCQHACTKGVQYLDLMIACRNQMSGGKKIPLLKKVVLFLYQSILFKKFAWLIGWLARTPLRRVFMLPRRRPRQLGRLLSGGQNNTPENADVLLFPGCVLSRFYPAIIADIHRLLSQAGFSVIIPRQLRCCGFPYKSQGWGARFERFRKQNLETLGYYRFKYLVAPCATCVLALKNDYPLQNVEILELSQFLHACAPDLPVTLSFTGAGGGKVAFHDPCHQLKSLRIKEAPRHFMRQMGERFVDDPGAGCCGFGGVFSIGFPDTSARILDRRRRRLEDAGAQTVVTSCPGCYMHLREHLDQQVLFITDIFAPGPPAGDEG